MQSKNLVVGQERPISGEVDLRNLCWWENPVVRLVYVETAGRLKNVLTQMGQIRWASQRGKRLETHINIGSRKVSEASNNFKGKVDLVRFHVKRTDAPCFGGMFNF